MFLAAGYHGCHLYSTRQLRGLDAYVIVKN